MVALPLTLPDTLVPFAPSATRPLRLHGADVELAWIPERRLRAGQDREHRPAFAPCPADRIIAEEAYWQDDALALTPNKYPFARDQRLLWMTRPAREPDLTFWRAATDWVERADGTALLNNIGAAATIARAHAHLVGERLPFLEQLGERTLRRAPIQVPAGCELVAKDLDRCVLGVRGPAPAQAEALALLADARLTETWNVILTRDAAWVVPRAEQTPAPDFPSPMGAAEFWGRFCYVDEAAFEAASERSLGVAWQRCTTTALA